MSQNMSKPMMPAYKPVVGEHMFVNILWFIAVVDLESCGYVIKTQCSSPVCISELLL